MLIPCIDLMDGKIVQLVHGKKKALEFTDAEPWVRKFEKYPLVHIVDLDAAKREGSNREVIATLTKRLHCQVGGGISSVAIARDVLAAGAKRVVIGSALISGEKINIEFAKEMANEIGSDKLVFSVDTKDGKLAINGWRETVPITVENAIAALNPYCQAFLYTHVDTEGCMSGFPMHVARQLTKLTSKKLIVGGGVRSLAEVDELDAMGADAVVGMAVYSGLIDL
jgi:phosphoribosylformimino-5-aminoimidazole carboxamide ribotide isomerase